MSNWITIQQAAGLFGCSRQAIDDRIKRGTLIALKSERPILVDADSIPDNQIGGRPSKPKPETKRKRGRPRKDAQQQGNK